jgi:hypothetical protein
MVNLAQLVAGLMLDLGQIPSWYTAGLNTEDEAPDNATVYCRVEGGGQRAQGDIGHIRAAARVVDRLRQLVDRVLADEAGEIAISISNIMELGKILSRDTLAEVKAKLNARILEAPMEAIAGLRLAQEEIGWHMEILSSPEGVRACVGCHCTDAQSCAEGCWWVGDKLCSSCLRAFIKATVPRGVFTDGSARARHTDHRAVARTLGQGHPDGAASDERSRISVKPGTGD